MLEYHKFNYCHIEASINLRYDQKQLEILTGKTLTAYFVIFGSTAFTWSAACKILPVAHYIQRQKPKLHDSITDEKPVLNFAKAF